VNEYNNIKTAWSAGEAVTRPEASVIMRIKTEELKEARIALEFETSVDRFPALRKMVLSGECDFTDPIRTRLRAVRIGEMVEVEGEIRTTVRLSCGRCLAEFASPLETPFTLTYAQQAPAAGEQSEPGAHEGVFEEDGLIYFQGEDIDLTDGIQEQVILSLPLRALCSDSCKGLCARCGADLNTAACGCLAATAGNPFAVLDQLRLKKG
jgi:uncharacterized protein